MNGIVTLNGCIHRNERRIAGSDQPSLHNLFIYLCVRRGALYNQIEKALKEGSTERQPTRVVAYALPFRNLLMPPLVSAVVRSRSCAHFVMRNCGRHWVHLHSIATGALVLKRAHLPGRDESVQPRAARTQQRLWDAAGTKLLLWDAAGTKLLL